MRRDGKNQIGQEKARRIMHSEKRKDTKKPGCIAGLEFSGRDERIRTSDHLHPMQVR